MSFLWPWLLMLLPLPWVVRRWLPPAGDRSVLRVPSLALFAVSTPNDTETHPRRLARAGPSLDMLLAAAAWVLLVLAAARPLATSGPQQLPVSGRELMLALDVSASMATADLSLDGPPLSRLAIARALAQEFLARRDGDRVGLIVFGKQAYLHTPLTFDVSALRSALDDTAIGLAGRETALGDAIALAASRTREFAGSERVLVLLTDGANTAGQLSAEQAGWIARREGLRIHAVGIGAGNAPKADSSTELDEKVLQELAEQTGGSYRPATDGQALAEFYRLVDRMEPVALGEVGQRHARELYHWPLTAALALAALQALRRRTRRATGDEA